MNEKESTKKIQLQSVSDLIPYSRNPRTHTDEQVSQIASSILEFGFTNPILVDKKNMVIAGHGRLLAARKLKLEKVPTICLDYLTETQKRAYVIADNKLALNAGWDDEMLKVEFEELKGLDFDMNLLGFSDEEISQNGNVGLDTGVSGSLSDKFGVPPFSVLNAADGWWQERKKQWISLGIESGRGRSEMRNRSTPIHKMAYFNKGELIAKEGGSIFDPVLAELVYRWFSPKGGIILDPFAGGSVRGIVASLTGRDYVGLDLNEQQIEENRRQAETLTEKNPPTWHCNDSRDVLEVCKGLEADLVFSCPPYADLEVYSDDPRDISNLSYSKFKKSYSEIISKTCGLLKNDSFACFVVGEVRDKDGHYYNFVADTIEAFRKAGLHYYNEAILVTEVGSLAVRVGKFFKTSRKLGKRHQNVLVFVKGDAREATRKCGEGEFGSLDVAEEMGEVFSDTR